MQADKQTDNACRQVNARARRELTAHLLDLVVEQLALQCLLLILAAQVLALGRRLHHRATHALHHDSNLLVSWAAG